MRGLLIIGDRKIDRHKRASSFNSFVDHIERLNRNGLEVHVVNYRDVFFNNLPEFVNPMLSIVLFFPYSYWKQNVETYKKDLRVYGDRKFGQEYKKIFEKIERSLKKKYYDKKIQYVNAPKSSILERDKKESKNLFQKNNIFTPKIFTLKEPEDIEQLINQGISLYIKPRFGSLGKGITYINKDLMVTNFLFRKGKIISLPHYYDWKFCQMDGNNRNKFLKGLLSKGFICEEAIDSLMFDGRRFDFRVYCLYGKVVYYYVRSVQVQFPVTNWSQGGRIEKKNDFLKYVSETQIQKVKSLARKVAMKLNLNYTGVDIIISKNSGKAYALEANSFPSFEMGFDLMAYLAKKICTLN